MAPKKKGGSKLPRSVVMTIRLDPKLRFAAELAARKQRRTLSSFVEWAIEKAVSSEVINPDHNGDTAFEAMTHIWDVDEADRFIKFAERYSELLTFDEEHLWKIIRETPYFFKTVNRKPNQPHLEWSERSDNIFFKRVRNNWELLNKIVAGKADIDALPDRPKDEINIVTGDELPF